MKIDAHQHYWQISRQDYGWLTPALGAIYRDFLPADLAPALQRCAVEQTILVQAAPTLAETRFLLDLADQHASIAGVVGWLDFDAPDALDQLNTLATQPKLVGLRPMMQDLPQDDWMLQAQVQRVLSAMAERGLVFDALVKPRHLRHLRVLAAQQPSLSIVIDHGAKPDIAGGQLHTWAQDMAALAALPHTVVKLSGLLTEAQPGADAPALQPYAQVLLSTFGPERMLWGSDWPVLELAASYEQWWQITQRLLAPLSAAQREAVLGGNAQRVYLQRHGRSASSS
jgi:L-fuconolactonase